MREHEQVPIIHRDLQDGSDMIKIVKDHKLNAVDLSSNPEPQLRHSKMLRARALKSIKNISLTRGKTNEWRTAYRGALDTSESTSGIFKGVLRLQAYPSTLSRFFHGQSHGDGILSSSSSRFSVCDIRRFVCSSPSFLGRLLLFFLFVCHCLLPVGAMPIILLRGLSVLWRV